jgi:hypothetical protein
VPGCCREPPRDSLLVVGRASCCQRGPRPGAGGDDPALPRPGGPRRAAPFAAAGGGVLPVGGDPAEPDAPPRPVGPVQHRRGLRGGRRGGGGGGGTATTGAGPAVPLRGWLLIAILIAINFFCFVVVEFEAVMLSRYESNAGCSTIDTSPFYSMPGGNYGAQGTSAAPRAILFFSQPAPPLHKYKGCRTPIAAP